MYRTLLKLRSTYLIDLRRRSAFWELERNTWKRQLFNEIQEC